MHHDIKYNDDDPKVNRARAIDDMKRWFGPEKFDELVKNVKLDIEEGRIKSTAYIRMAIGMGGVEGYPVKVFIEEYCFPLTEAEDEDS